MLYILCATDTYKQAHHHQTALIPVCKILFRVSATVHSNAQGVSKLKELLHSLSTVNGKTSVYSVISRICYNYCNPRHLLKSAAYKLVETVTALRN